MFDLRQWLVCGLMCHALAAAAASVVPPEDTNAVLHNPDMGWVIYEGYPLDGKFWSSPEDFPDVDAVGIMFTWQDVEHREGVYDFSKVDAAFDFWRKHGKAIQLRMSTASLIYWENQRPPAGRGVPEYVVERMAPNEKQVRKIGPDSYTVYDYRNAYCRQRLRAFLDAVEKHFGADRPVSLIDLRGFGAWGEWHSGFHYPNLATRRAALKDILNIWTAALPDHMLALSYSYDPDGPREFYAGPKDKLDPQFTANHAMFLNYSAFDDALAKSNITWRRDGAGGAVHSNERLLNDEAFRLYHRAPMMSEFVAGYGAMKKGGSNWISRVVDDALSLHPNYINLIGWQGPDARNFAAERPELIARGLREMGYRFVPVRIEYPGLIAGGGPLEIRTEWVNRGLGRALRDYEVQYLIIDSKGGRIAESRPEILPTSQWLKGASYPITQTVVFLNVPPGDYKIAFQMTDPSSHRAIALPIPKSGRGNCWEIGPIGAR